MSESITTVPVTTTRLIFAVDPQTSFRRGVPCPTPPKVAVEVDPATLSEEERELIARRLTSTGLVQSRALYCNTEQTYGLSYGNGGHCTGPIPVTALEPTLVGLLAAIRAEEEGFRAELAARQAKREQEEAAERAQVDAWLAGDDEEQVTLHRSADPYYWCSSDRLGMAGASLHYRTAGSGNRYRNHVYTSVTHGDYRAAEVAAKISRLDAIVAGRDKLTIDLLIEEYETAQQERADWIAAHGSPRLKRLVAEGIGHEKTYETERAKYEESQFAAALAAERPGWYEVDADDVEQDLADVSSRALALLDAARLLDSSARLAWVKDSKKYVAVADFRGRLIAWPAE